MEMSINHEADLTRIQAEHSSLVKQIQELDEKMKSIQADYQKQRDSLLTRGIELQGQIKLLQGYIPKPVETSAPVNGVTA